MVEIKETDISLKTDNIDKFLDRLRLFILDAFRDAKDQLKIPEDQRIVTFSYKIES